MSLHTILNLPYRQEKLLKKLYGKNLAYEIALGRKLMRLFK